MPDNFLNTLRAWMAKEGISQGEAARRLNITRSWLNRVLSEKDEPGAALIRTFNEIAGSPVNPEQETSHVLSDSAEDPQKLNSPGDFTDYLRTLPDWYLLARIRDLLRTPPFEGELYAAIEAEITRRILRKDLPPPPPDPSTEIPP